MFEIPLGVPIKNPLKSRIIRLVCRHTRRKPGSQTYEFPERVQVRYHKLRWRELYLEVPMYGRRLGGGGPWELRDKYQYKCPRCGCDLQLRAATMLRLIDAFDAVERQRSGDTAANTHRLDISVAELVLTSSR
jgi:hypothetical protein